MELNLLSVLKSVTAIRCDVSAMSDSDVGDQQMLLTNFQYFDAVSLISTRGWYPVHERFPLSSSSSSASNHSGQCNDFHWFFLCRNTSRKSRVHPNCATLNIHFSQNLLIGQTTSVRCILCLFFSLITDISLVLSRCLMDNRNGIQPVNTLHQWLPTVLPWEWFCYQAYSGVIAGKIGRLNKKRKLVCYWHHNYVFATFCLFARDFFQLNTLKIVWLGGRVVGEPDLQSTGRRFESRPTRCPECNSGQIVYTRVSLSPRSIIWYRPMSGDARRLGEVTALRVWRKVMAAYRRVYGFGHLRADCRGRDQLRNLMLVSSKGLPIEYRTIRIADEVGCDTDIEQTAVLDIINSDYH